MNRHVMAMAAGVALLIAGVASAAPTTESAAKAGKSEEKVCVRGEGKEFVYPVVYVSECEVGNAGFFTTTASSKTVKNAGFADASCCAAGKSAKDVKTVSAQECAAGASCCEVGNAAFFNNATCCDGKHAAMHNVKVKKAKKTKESASR